MEALKEREREIEIELVSQKQRHKKRFQHLDVLEKEIHR
jgi:hypothetical protein